MTGQSVDVGSVFALLQDVGAGHEVRPQVPRVRRLGGDTLRRWRHRRATTRAAERVSGPQAKYIKGWMMQLMKIRFNYIREEKGVLEWRQLPDLPAWLNGTRLVSLGREHSGMNSLPHGFHDVPIVRYARS